MASDPKWMTRPPSSSASVTAGRSNSVTVTWPNKSQTIDSWANVPADHYIELRQSDPNVYGINLP